MKFMLISLGGSSEPVVASILKHKPEYVCFFASQQSRALTGEVSRLISKKGHEITYESVVCDDVNNLVYCYEKVLECTDKLAEKGANPENVVVDYTGGTKTMTVALTLATFGHGYNFSYVGGENRTKNGMGVVISGEELVMTDISPWQIVAVEEQKRKSLFVSSYIAQAEQEKALARVEERNKIIADMSHNIKNLISTVTDPLENLKQEKIVKPQVIENALKGTNLIRETVNAVNLSFKGSVDDFYYDARHNTGRDKSDFQFMITESLKYSISHMFDGKYFGKFNQKYFPAKETHLSAKSEWEKISQAENINAVSGFINKYFFKHDMVLGNAAGFAIGNNKGSAIKLLILIQELIFNAVKYSAFVSYDRRFISIRFANGMDRISFKVENSFKSNVKTKTSGIGHIIVENFGRLLNTDPIINKQGNIYSVEIIFPNFWKVDT